MYIYYITTMISDKKKLAANGVIGTFIMFTRLRIKNNNDYLISIIINYLVIEKYLLLI